MRYGANGKFTVKTVPNGTPCTNATFGDPNPGVPKKCSICRGPSLFVSGHKDNNYNGKYFESGAVYKRNGSEHYIFYKSKTNKWIMQPSKPSSEWRANTYARGQDPTTAVGWREGIRIVYK